MCLGWSKNCAGKFPKELQKQTESKRWIETERRWKRKKDSRGSSQTRERRWPKEKRKSQPTWFIGPKGSNAIGKKLYLLDISKYFSCFRAAAASAAEPAQDDVMFNYVAPTVSVTVTSQVAQRPSLHGLNVRLSGRYPSDLRRLCGSLMEGSPAFDNGRQIRSFIKWWRCDR